jgi:hypothetical protein
MLFGQLMAAATSFIVAGLGRGTVAAIFAGLG